MEKRDCFDAMVLELNPLMPPQSFLYFPTDIDMKVGSGAKATRRLFKGSVSFDAFEQKELDKFRTKLAAEKKITLSSWWEDGEMMRMLYATQFKYDKAVKSMVAHSEWRAQTMPAKYTQTTEAFLRSGVIYMFGRDEKYRPIIIIDASKIVLNDSTKIEDIIAGMTYFFEFMLRFAMLPGQIENWAVIFDLNSIGLTSLPISALKAMAQYLSNNYRSRMYATYVLNAPSSIFIPWSIIKAFLDESTIQKISFSKTGYAPRLFEHAHSSQIPVKYGGTAANPVQYWPPRVMDCSCYKTELISIAQYYDMYVSNQLANHVVCLNYLQKQNETMQMNRIEPIHLKSSIINVLSICQRQSSEQPSEFADIECNGYLDVDSAPLLRKGWSELKQTSGNLIRETNNSIMETKEVLERKPQSDQFMFYSGILGVPIALSSKLQENRGAAMIEPSQQQYTSSFNSMILGVSIPLKQQQQEQQQQQQQNQQKQQIQQQQFVQEVRQPSRSKVSKDEVSDDLVSLNCCSSGQQEHCLVCGGVVDEGVDELSQYIQTAASIPKFKNNCRNGQSIMDSLNLFASIIQHVKDVEENASSLIQERLLETNDG